MQINGSPAKVGGQKTHFRSSLNSTAVLNLNCSLVFFFKSFYLYFFEKSTKNGAAVSGIRCFLCSRVALRHLSVGSHLAACRLSQCLGWQELASLKHHATCFQSLLGCSLCLPTLPSRRWRGITFCTAFLNSLHRRDTAMPCPPCARRERCFDFAQHDKMQNGCPPENRGQEKLSLLMKRDEQHSCGGSSNMLTPP